MWGGTETGEAYKTFFQQDLGGLVSEEDNADFKKEYGHSNDYSLSDALWTCSNMFSNW